MCWTIMWHFKQNPDALMCFFFPPINAGLGRFAPLQEVPLY